MNSALDELFLQLKNSSFSYNHAMLIKDSEAELLSLYRQIELASTRLVVLTQALRRVEQTIKNLLVGHSEDDKTILNNEYLNVRQALHGTKG